MYGIYEPMATLQYRYRSLSEQLEQFKTGEKYIQMDAEYKKLLRHHNKEVCRFEYELSKAHSETIAVRKLWEEVFEDLEKEHLKKVRRLLAEIKRLEKIILEVTRQRDEALDKYQKRNLEYYDVATELEKEIEKTRRPYRGYLVYKNLSEIM